MARITKNSISYDGGDVVISMLGIPDIYAESIDYKTTQEHQLNYGLSREPRTWSKGKKEYSCTLELTMDDIVSLQTSSEKNSLIEIAPFNIVVSYLPQNETLLPVIDKVVAKFKESGRTVSNEMGLKQSFELFVLHIEENINP